MEVKQRTAVFAINRVAAEASQAACCRSTMGPKMAAKLEADNDSGPHTTEAYYEEQDVRKVFSSRTDGSQQVIDFGQQEVAMKGPRQVNYTNSCSGRWPRRAGATCRRAPLNRPWQHCWSPLVSTLLATLLILFGQQISVKSHQLASSNGAITSTVFNGRAQQHHQELRSISAESPERIGGTELVRAEIDRNLISAANHDRETKHQFKYHLNHLRPPSLVPITIVQQATTSAKVADQTMAASTSSDWSAPMDDERVWQRRRQSGPFPAFQLTLSPHRAIPDDPSQTAVLTMELANTSAVTNYESTESDRLVQLQLPLQLHLKLKPLPLPMPPPSERRLAPSSWPDGTEAKRKRSLEQSTPEPATSSPVVATTTQPPQIALHRANNGASQVVTLRSSRAEPEGDTAERRDLIWREAKRILLLSSMSPVLVQAKLDRRFADLPGPEQVQQRPQLKAISDNHQPDLELMVSSNRLPQLGERAMKARRTTTDVPAVANAAPSSSADGQHWRSGSTVGKQQGAVDGQQHHPATTQTDSSELLGRLGVQTTPRPHSDTSIIATTRQDPTAATTTTETIPATTTDVPFKNLSAPFKLLRGGGGVGGGGGGGGATLGEVRRQRHSSQQLQGHSQTPTGAGNLLRAAELATGAAPDADRIQALAAAMLPFFWPSFQLAGNAANSESSQARFRLWKPATGDEEPTRQQRHFSGGPRLDLATKSVSNVSSAMAASVLSPTVVSLDQVSNSLPEPNHGPIPAGELAAATQGENHWTVDSLSDSTATMTTAPSSSTTTKAPTTSERVDVPAGEAKRRRRKPSYLLQAISAAPASSTPYPDSTRLASKYPLPKIKFQPRGDTTVPALAANNDDNDSQQLESHRKLGALSSRKASRSSLVGERKLRQKQEPEKTNGDKSPSMKLVQVPKSLSKLIEHQLLINATGLLMEHKNRSLGSGGLPPTTSISKVVRLRNDTDSQIVMSTVSSVAMGSSSKPSEFPNDLQRFLTTTSTSNYPPSLLQLASTNTQSPTLAPPTTTTPMPFVQPRSSSNTTPIVPANWKPASEGWPSALTGKVEGSSPLATTTTTLPVGTEAPSTEGAAKLSSGRRAASPQPSGAQRRQPPARASTEPSGLYRSLPTPSQAPNRQQQQEEPVGSNKVLPEEEDSGPNQRFTTVASSAEYPLASPSSSPAPPTSTTSSKRQVSASIARSAAGPKPKRFGSPGQASNGSSSSLQQRRNIKLFHFKRKPDMNKLPFYKKPLNYTELGWSSEQIQEHLESIGLAPVGGQPELAGGISVGSKFGTGNESAEEFQLLKRKRRGKSQFDRLMAELHGTSGNQQSTTTTGQLSGFAGEREAETGARYASAAAPGEPSVESEPEQDQEREQTADDLVPVMKKKTEPLVMKPMFFVMNQKRRNMSLSLERSSPTTSEVSKLPASALLESTTSEPNSQETDDDDDTHQRSGESNGKAHNKSRPIIRMRRKHNGDQPQLHKLTQLPILQLLGQQQAAPWRPSKPFWSSAASAASADRKSLLSGDKLLLIPSGILTPSGSHLVPLYAPSQLPAAVDEQSRHISDYLAWRPGGTASGSLALLGPWQSGAPLQEIRVPVSKPSGGMAPNGEESFLVAPSAPMSFSQAEPVGAGERLTLPPAQLSGSASKSAGQVPLISEKSRSAARDSQTAASNQQTPLQTVLQSKQEIVGELRVPKLLKKPMRPAKYSLNGYIPKPLLGQQQQANQQQQQQQQPQQQQPTNSATAKQKTKSRSSSPLNGAPIQNKDLDSSTSNEIFSRRRGLQQQQRGLLANNLDSSPVTGQPQGSQAAPGAMSAQQRQVEQSKRKYMQAQQQEAVSMPALSVHKANLIKAKLGLIVNTQSSNSYKHQQAASTNAVITSDPNAQPASGPSDERGDLASKSAPLIGAPLNSIPKTDFECTDKKGMFVSGLYADQKTGCQVWHLCSNNRKYSFLCPAGTIFNAKLRICDWRYNVKCENSLPF